MREILLVDDDPSIQDVFAEVLAGEGYSIASAANGREALTYLEGRRAAPPLLILLDLMMPVMDGYEFLDTYARAPGLPEVPVVVMSAHGRVTRGPGLRRISRQLQKPVALDVLVSALDSLCPTSSSPASFAQRRADCDGRVLVVEDDDALREAVVEILKDDGFTVTTARNGAEAIEMLEKGPLPCVALVDLMMPVMTGWELVERMRAQEALASIPVVVASAASERSPPGVAAVLSKPLSLETLVGAVAHYCKATKARSGERDDALRELARRNVELVELQRFRDEMSAMIVHDMKSPLTAILSNVEYVLMGQLSEEGDKREALADTQDAAGRLLRLIENLLQLVKLESGRFVPQRRQISAPTLLEPLVRRRSTQAQERNLVLELRPIPKLSVSVDADLLCRALDNILDNAFRYTPAGGKIVVDVEAVESVLRIRIGNSGSSIPPASRRKIFEKFGQAEKDTGRTNLGLGLYFCRLVLEAHGGRIEIDDLPDLPTVFTLELPL